MLDLFLGAAYARERETQEKRATINALRKLPTPLLMKLASGEVKLGYGDCAPDGNLHNDKQNTWLAQFEGTPLQEQAVSLEQQDIALEMQEIQQRAEDRAEREAKDSERDPIYDQRDQLRMQKKLLELQLQQSELTASAPASVDPQKKPPVPEAGNPGAGSMGPVAPSSDGELGSVGKTAAMDPSEVALQEQAAKYDAMRTPGQKIREGLSTLGGTVAGGALGAGAGYAGGALLNRLGVKGVTPGGLATGLGIGGGALGMGFGGLVGGSHGQSDVDLGKAHERYADAEDQVYGPGIRKKMAAQMGEELAKIALTLPNMQQLGSMAGQARSAIGGLAQKAAPVVQNAWGKLSPGAQKGLMLGAAGGAVEGGVRGLMGQEDHKLHPMGALTGALTGGTVGGAMGAGAGHLMGKYMPLGKI